MTDRISREKRSWNMSRIRSRNTAPELAVRSLMHGMGLRYKLHEKALPGSPDIVLPKHRTVVFVHGCFWHRHEGCRLCTTPSVNIDFWNQKFTRNVQRDREAAEALQQSGWRVICVWSCELAAPGTLRSRIAALFRPASPRKRTVTRARLLAGNKSTRGVSRGRRN